MEWKYSQCTVSNEWDTIYYQASKFILLNKSCRMLRKEETPSWVVKGCVGSENRLESSPHLQAHHALGHSWHISGTHNQRHLRRKDPDFFSESESDHSGLENLNTPDVIIKGDHHKCALIVKVHFSLCSEIESKPIHGTN